MQIFGVDLQSRQAESEIVWSEAKLLVALN